MIYSFDLFLVREAFFSLCLRHNQKVYLIGSNIRSNMIPRNTEREEECHKCWNNGLTIDEATSKLMMPRSSVGYYYRKFNKAIEKGQNPRPPRAPANKPKITPELERLLTAVGWGRFSVEWAQLMNEKKYSDAKDYADAYLSSFRVCREIQPYLKDRSTDPVKQPTDSFSFERMLKKYKEKIENGL